MRIEMPDGEVRDFPKMGGDMTLPFLQAMSLAEKLRELQPHVHWHMNECGCCLSVHGSDCAYVIGSDGHATFFANRGCDCP